MILTSIDSLAQSTFNEAIWAIWTVGNCGMRAMFMAGGSMTTGPTVGRGGKERIVGWVTGGRVMGAVVAGAMKAGMVTGRMGSTIITCGGGAGAAVVGCGVDGGR